MSPGLVHHERAVEGHHVKWWCAVLVFLTVAFLRAAEGDLGAALRSGSPDLGDLWMEADADRRFAACLAAADAAFEPGVDGFVPVAILEFLARAEPGEQADRFLSSEEGLSFRGKAVAAGARSDALVDRQNYRRYLAVVRSLVANDERLRDVALSAFVDILSRGLWTPEDFRRIHADMRSLAGEDRYDFESLADPYVGILAERYRAGDVPTESLVLALRSFDLGGKGTAEVVDLIIGGRGVDELIDAMRWDWVGRAVADPLWGGFERWVDQGVPGGVIEALVKNPPSRPGDASAVVEAVLRMVRYRGEDPRLLKLAANLGRSLDTSLGDLRAMGVRVAQRYDVSLIAGDYASHLARSLVALSSDERLPGLMHDLRQAYLAHLAQLEEGTMRPLGFRCGIPLLMAAWYPLEFERSELDRIAGALRMTADWRGHQAPMLRGHERSALMCLLLRAQRRDQNRVLAADDWAAFLGPTLYREGGGVSPLFMCWADSVSIGGAAAPDGLSASKRFLVAPFDPEVVEETVTALQAGGLEAQLRAGKLVLLRGACGPYREHRGLVDVLDRLAPAADGLGEEAVDELRWFIAGRKPEGAVDADMWSRSWNVAALSGAWRPRSLDAVPPDSVIARICYRMDVLGERVPLADVPIDLAGGRATDTVLAAVIDRAASIVPDAQASILPLVLRPSGVAEIGGADWVWTIEWVLAQDGRP